MRYIFSHLKARQFLVLWVSAALSVEEQLVEVLLSVSISGRCQSLFVHALRASIRNYEPKTHMHF